MRHTIFDPPTADHFSVWNVLKPSCFWRRGDLNSSGSLETYCFPHFLIARTCGIHRFETNPNSKNIYIVEWELNILDVNWYDLVWPQIRLSKVLVLWRLEHLSSFAVCRECLRLPAGHRVSGTVGALCWGPEDCVAKLMCLVDLQHPFRIF
jgi:hypothetical protein